MAAPKTRPTGDDVDALLDQAPEGRREDAHRLRALMEEVTGEPAVAWGSMVGFGSHPLTTASGTNDWFVVGFAPRKAALVLYGLLEGDGSDDPRLGALGPHTTGKSCLNLKRLDAVDLDVLRDLVRSAWRS